MANNVVKVRREVIAEIMMCPICHKLFREATTISECLHTFCRKCIHKKLSDEELENCPVCDIDLGCSPLEKLRPDHNLQDVRSKIFPFKRKEKAPEAPSVTPVKRKERSLSSLVVDAPRVSPQTSRTGKRTKATPRKTSSLRGPSFHLEKPDKDDEDSAEDLPERFSSPEMSNKLTPNNRQNSSNAESSSHPEPKQGAESGAETCEAKVDLWKPLNCLVEAANRSKSPTNATNASQESAAKSEPRHTPNNEVHIRKRKVKEHGTKCEAQEKRDDSDIISPDGDKTKKLRRVRRKKAASSGDYVIPPQAVLDAGIGNGHKRAGPIWFSLVASEDQEDAAQLPQISASYLRIKDGTMPVSFIQKYLVRKLDLTNEKEVEIKCLGQSVIPTLQLNSLVELWLQSTATSQRVPALIGSSAKDFVMVLAYARKCPSP